QSSLPSTYPGSPACPHPLPPPLDTDSDPDAAPRSCFPMDLVRRPRARLRNVHVHSEAVHVHVHDDVASTCTCTCTSTWGCRSVQSGRSACTVLESKSLPVR